MTSVGVFGKVPTHGDFVARGTGSRTGRSFERWAQMANDRMAELGQELPSGPIGFVFRDEAHESLLVGTLIASRDRVGRTFPLALFCELDESPPFPTLPGALATVVERFAEIALAAAQHPPAELFAAIEDVPIPGADELAARAAAESARLADVPVALLLDRIFRSESGTGDARHYGLEVLLRACDSTGSYGSIKTPLALDLRVTSDIELSFWLACIAAALPGSIGTPSIFWDVSACRCVAVLGVPESNSLHVLKSRGVQYQRLWPTVTESTGSRRDARARLDEDLARMLEAPGATTAQEFVTGLISRSRSGPEQASTADTPRRAGTKNA